MGSGSPFRWENPLYASGEPWAEGKGHQEGFGCPRWHTSGCGAQEGFCWLPGHGTLVPWEDRPHCLYLSGSVLPVAAVISRAVSAGGLLCLILFIESLDLARTVGCKRAERLVLTRMSPLMPTQSDCSRSHRHWGQVPLSADRFSLHEGPAGPSWAGSDFGWWM